MKKIYLFLSMWLVNGVLLLLANWFFPMDFVLGTWRRGVFGSAVVAAALWTIITLLVEPFMKVINFKPKNAGMSMLVYLVVNFVALWVTARMAPLTGFGVSGWLWILILAVVANVVQYMNWMVLDKAKLVEK